MKNPPQKFISENGRPEAHSLNLFDFKISKPLLESRAIDPKNNPEQVVSVLAGYSVDGAHCFDVLDSNALPDGKFESDGHGVFF